MILKLIAESIGLGNSEAILALSCRGLYFGPGLGLFRRDFADH